MIKLIELLKEIADSPYSLTSPSYHKETNFSNYIDYEFTTDTGKEYYIRFNSTWAGREKEPNQKYNWKTELTFFPTAKRYTSKTEEGGENFGKILATVGEALKKYTTTYKPEYVFWKGIKGEKEQNTGDSTKRQRIYNMLMDRMASGITGYTPIKGDKLSSIMTNNKIPIPGANKIFIYPEEPSFYNAAKAKAIASRFNLQR